MQIVILRNGQHRNRYSNQIIAQIQTEAGHFEVKSFIKNVKIGGWHDTTPRTIGSTCNNNKM